MVNIFENVLSPEDIQTLIAYSYLDDDRTDSRPDVRSKHPRWDIDCWPQIIIQSLLDKILDRPYSVEDILFLEHRMPGQSPKLHVDSGNGNSNLYNAILIPLSTNGFAGTVFFSNYWFGARTRFSCNEVNPFCYPLQSRTGTIVMVEDIRELYKQCREDPTSVTDFEVNVKFLNVLHKLIETRQGFGIAGPPHGTVTDYRDIANFNPHKKFDSHIHEKYMPHLPINSLHGLSIDKIVEWRPGSVIVFPRTQLHCGTATHTHKVGISLFTNLI